MDKSSSLTNKPNTRIKRPHRHNLILLEAEALKAHANWREDDTHSNRTQMFLAIRDLARAILDVKPAFAKYGIDYDETAYEYAVYLFERVLRGGFTMNPHQKDTTFPLQVYISLNIKHIIFSRKEDEFWKELVQDLEMYLDNPALLGDLPSQPSEEGKFDAHYYGKRILKILRIHYSSEEIRRLLPLALEVIYQDQYQLVHDHFPSDLSDFVSVLVATAKSMSHQDNLTYGTNTSKNNLKKALNAAVRSTVFLSTITSESYIPRELLLALDADSLHRLVSIAGGKKITIPTQRDLDSLIGGVVTVSKMILEGKNQGKALEETKAGLNLTFSRKVNTQYFISKALECFNVFGDQEKHSSPLVATLVSSIGALNGLLKRIRDEAQDLPPESALHQYSVLSESFSRLTEAIMKVGASQQHCPPEVFPVRKEKQRA